MGKLSASILSADLANLAEQVKAVHDHADVIHVDVMDGRFAPWLTIGPVVVSSIRRHTDRVVHGHLLVEEPQGLFDELAESGADLVSIHPEAVDDPGPHLAKARGAGLGVGLAIAPAADAAAVFPYLEDLDDVTVVSGPPAAPARGFLPEVLAKVQAVRNELDRRGIAADLAVDGGVDLENARRCVDAGANVLVVGAGLFGAPDVAGAGRALKAIVEAA
ncbi:MAG TPA: ribulose-phosphate 3-epimerase [Actinomycetota bacterium]|nr:ribulose-phosphate 3-epimerase [Actinomycetota bacterium]